MQNCSVKLKTLSFSRPLFNTGRDREFLKELALEEKNALMRKIRKVVGQEVTGSAAAAMALSYSL